MTGSLNASVAQWLIGSGRLAPPYVARQGTVLGRSGRVHISVDGDGVWVAGRHHHVHRGNDRRLNPRFTAAGELRPGTALRTVRATASSGPRSGTSRRCRWRVEHQRLRCGTGADRPMPRRAAASPR